MAYQKVGIGTNANDGTGDTLRVGADKINENFEDLFGKINGVANSAISDGTALTSDVVVLRTTSETLTNKTLTAPVLGGTTTTASGNLIVDPATQIVEVRGDGSSIEGQIQLNCHVNTHGQKITAADHSVNATNTLTLPGGSVIGNANATLVSDTGTQTLSNKTLTEPKIADGGFIADANGAEQVIFQTTASAVNEIEITNAATGGSAVVSTSTAPIIGASGETNVDLALLPKGTGITTIRSTGGTNNQGAIRLNCENNTHGQTLMSQPHSANDSSFFMLPKGSTANNDRTAPDVLLSGDKTVGTTEAVSTATALSLDTMISELTTAGSGLAMTLANGVVGQIKIITMVVDGGGTATLTPATFANGTTIAFDDVNDTVMLLYANTIGWVVISNSGATVS
tara:strand:- start:353 stop:1549 length:1197 start_codon:yes stop_codon:yes gene_type:complete